MWPSLPAINNVFHHDYWPHFEQSVTILIIHFLILTSTNDKTFINEMFLKQGYIWWIVLSVVLCSADLLYKLAAGAGIVHPLSYVAIEVIACCCVWV